MMTEEQEKLAVENIGLAKHIALTWNRTINMELDDLIGIAQLGLVKASIKFDQNKGVRFSTFAARVIENEILMELRRLKKVLPAVSIEEMVPGTDDIPLCEIISDQKDCFSVVEMAEMLRKGSCKLTDQERKAVYIGIIYPDMKQQSRGKVMGISQSRYSRHLKNAKRKIFKANV